MYHKIDVKILSDKMGEWYRYINSCLQVVLSAWMMELCYNENKQTNNVYDSVCVTQWTHLHMLLR